MRDLSNKLGLLMVSMSVGVYLLDGFLGFHMDLLALFLGFHMDLLALCDGEISVLRGDTTLHYIVSHWGCSLLEAAAMAASVTTRRMLRIHLSSLLLLFCCFLLWHLLSI